MDTLQKNIHVLSSSFNIKVWLKAWPEFEQSYVVLDDHLISGQLTSAASVQGWITLRRKAMKQLGFDEELYPATDNKNIMNNCQRLQQAESITIWSGSVFADQLIIAFMIYFMQLINAKDTTIKLIEFPPFLSGRHSTIHILNIDELRRHPKPTVLKDSLVKDYHDAWLALCADTPDRLMAYLNITDERLPLFREGLQVFVARYPNKETGLLRWDWILLQVIKEKGPTATRVIGFSMMEANGNDWVGDGYLWHRLQVMANHPKPLVVLTPCKHEISSMKDTAVQLTDFGAQVLNGETSAYPDCPIDEWIGGVHLCSAEDRLWFYQDGEIVKY